MTTPRKVYRLELDEWAFDAMEREAERRRDKAIHGAGTWQTWKRIADELRLARLTAMPSVPERPRR